MAKISERFKFVIAGVVIGLIALFILRPTTSSHRSTQNTHTLQTYTVTELAQYDGSNPNSPIYIGLDGLVYDVSAGRSYYQVGGTYHWLAGKDSSTELHLVGGDIIKKKYPIIGRLVQ